MTISNFANFFNHHQFRQYVAVLIATFALVSSGMNIGWPSAVLPKLLSDNPPIQLSLNEISWVISIMNLSNILSPYPVGFLMDKFGRKHILLVFSILPILCWMLVIKGKTTLVLCTARFLVGLWQGVVQTVLPVYVAEITEPQFRMQMGTFLSFMTFVGLLITYIIGPLLSFISIAIVSAIFPIIFFLSFIWMPESPVYYLMHKDHLKAKNALTWFRGNLEIDQINNELEGLEKSTAKDMENKGGIKDIFSTKGTIKAFIITNVLAFVARFSGILSILVFSSSILPKAGFFFISKDQFVIVLGVILIIFTFISAFFMKHYGNVQLLVASSLGCAIPMFVIGEWFYFNVDYPDIQLYEWIPYICLATHAICFSLGLGTISNTLKGEMFPTNIRAVSSAMTTNSASIASFLQTKSFFYIAEVYGMHMNYWFNCACCIASAIFSFFYVIETKGRSLNEIQEDLQKNTK